MKEGAFYPVSAPIEERLAAALLELVGSLREMPAAAFTPRALTAMEIAKIELERSAVEL